MKYDDASWHNGGDGFPAESPSEFGAVHIGLFFGWCGRSGLLSDFQLEDEFNSGATRKMLEGQTSSTECFLQTCDGKLTDEDLSGEGNRFAEAYYEQGYLSDYMALYGDLLHRAPEEEHEISKLNTLLDQRLKEFNQGGAKKPWWKFW